VLIAFCLEGYLADDLYERQGEEHEDGWPA
jgi:hypothetical protein